MVALSAVLASKNRIPATLPQGLGCLVAVVVGATSGIGEYTAKCFAKRAIDPRLYLVGRSQAAGDRAVAECKTLNPQGTFTFISADVGLLADVDRVCRAIKEKNSTVNILFMTQGSLSGNYGIQKVEI
ncbi:hypothetical protein N7512_002757 [Penicillium capsulatum]|nr:hypothetical protein N7512_002757 [Penicillium capsulatum]